MTDVRPRLLGAADIGWRVTVRRQLTSPVSAYRATDVVGTLVALDDASMTLRGREGQDHLIDTNSILHARRIPDDGQRLRHAKDVDPATLERISADGWRPSESLPLGGWRLRSAAGFTGRANSVLPLGEADRPLGEALKVVVEWYRERHLPARFQVPLPWAHKLDDALAAQGWAVLNPVRVMVADLVDIATAVDGVATASAPATRVSVASTPDADWLAAYRYRGQPLPAGADAVLTNADYPLFVSLHVSDELVAVGRGAMTGRWLGVTAIEVVPQARRQGFGRALLLALVEAGQRQGARYVYLQVAEDNSPAIALYELTGFSDHHRYHYRTIATD